MGLLDRFRRAPPVTPTVDPYNTMLTGSMKSNISSYIKEAKSNLIDLEAGIEKSEKIFTDMDNQLTLIVTKDTKIIDFHSAMKKELESLFTLVRDSKKSLSDLAYEFQISMREYEDAADLDIDTSYGAIRTLNASLPIIEKGIIDEKAKLDAMVTKLSNFNKTTKSFELNKDDMLALNKLIKDYISPHIKSSNTQLNQIKTHKNKLIALRNSALKKMQGSTYGGKFKR